MTDETGKPGRWGILVLFASLPALLCCALPILLVSLGMGSVVAALYGRYFPFLQWFGHHDAITFGVTAAILGVAAWLLYRPGRICPVDPALSAACDAAQKWNARFFWAAVVIWAIGAFTAYILPILAS